MKRQCVECLGGWFVFRGPAAPQFVQAGPFKNREEAELRAADLDLEEAAACIEWAARLEHLSEQRRDLENDMLEGMREPWDEPRRER